MFKYLFYLFGLVHARDIICRLDCSSDCVRCVDRIIVGGAQQVTFDLSLCKGGSTLSWLCCPDCVEQVDCDGEQNGLKCDEVTQVTYTMPLDATYADVQIHDGRMAGNIDCNTESCCGGSGTSCGTISGVCNFRIQLDTCVTTPIDGGGGGNSDTPEPECLVDSDCVSTDCGDGTCSYGMCVLTAKPLGHVCRESRGVCDQTETCNGVDVVCPEDRLEPAGFVCRSAVLATDGTTCDAPETCDGVNDHCPEDLYLPTGTICRPSADPCDVVDTCAGDTVACPSDLRNDFAKTFKCGTTCYLCGVGVEELGRNNGGASLLGGCSMGKCKTFVALPWPACETECNTQKCPNGKDLSNIEHHVCDKNDGTWDCVNKIDVSSSTVFPICPVYM